MSRKDPELTVKRKVSISPDLAERIEAEVNRNPSLYRNNNGQISEGELHRRALALYLDTAINQLTDAQSN
jgi:hypothetical protein